MKYKKRPIIVEATQWFKNGDHPLDGPADQEGQIVRYYRHPHISGECVCSKCNTPFHAHGWIDTLEGGYIVCPGDWIITRVAGEHYPCKPEIFEATYDCVEQTTSEDV